MKDINFSDYKKNQNRRANSDTGKIPLTETEREFLERRNQERYEQIIKSQRSSERDPSSPQKNTYIQNNKKEHFEDHRQPKDKKNKKKGCGCSTLILSIFLILAIFSGGTVGYVYSLCSKTKYEPTSKSFSFDLTELSNLNKNVYNILLIGTDKEENGASRSDTMILVSIDKTNEQIKFTSFMRDLWVSIPGYSNARLNSAYTKGGASLLIQTISENFDISIDNYILVNFEMFEKLIDGIGGVTVEITENEAAFINRTTHAKVTEGINTLNGDYALIYCRIRKLDSDFMRTQRQRKVMTAIVEKVTKQNIFKTAKAASEILPLITTDINAYKMTFKILSAVTMLDYSSEQLRIPIDGAYSDKTINGQAVLVPNIEKNNEEISNFIYG